MFVMEKWGIDEGGARGTYGDKKRREKGGKKQERKVTDGKERQKK